MYYYETPNYSVALNAKVGSSSMARAVIAEFQQREDFLLRTAVFPPGQTEQDRQWHWLAKGSTTPSKPVVLLVRDPVERFATACQQVRIRQKDVDAAIESLVNDADFVRTKPDDVTPQEWEERAASGRRRAAKMAARRAQRVERGLPVRQPRNRLKLRGDVHFFHQHLYAVGPTHCFRFPRDIAAAAQFIGISTPMPETNKAKRPKPILTPQQERRVREYYAKDVALFRAIETAGFVYTPPAT